MKGKGMKMIGMLMMVLASPAQPDVYELSPFSAQQGAAVSTLSGAAEDGFTVTYTSAPQDTRVITSASLSDGRTLAVGESAEFSFTFFSTQVSTLSLGFGWGFDFGTNVVFYTADTGVPAYTFHQHRYDEGNGFPFTTGASAGSWKSTPLPMSTNYLSAGNSVDVVTTLERTGTDQYSSSVQWGGQVYTSAFTCVSDPSMDTVFFRSGSSASPGMSVGDNYAISDVALSFSENEAANIIKGEGYEGITDATLLNHYVKATGGSGTEVAKVEHEIVRAGNSSVKMRVVRNLGTENNYRCEIVHKDPASPWKKYFLTEVGEEYWYGFSIYLPEDWEYDANEAEIIAQWHGQPDFDDGEDWRNPNGDIAVRNNTLTFYQKWDADLVTEMGKYDGTSETNLVEDIGPLLGTWMDFVVHVRWEHQPNGKGFTKLWLNGELKIDREGPNCFNDRTGGPYFRYGIYKWAWKDPSRDTTVTERVLYHDETYIGGADSSYQEVSPHREPIEVESEDPSGPI